MREKREGRTVGWAVVEPPIRVVGVLQTVQMHRLVVREQLRRRDLRGNELRFGVVEDERRRHVLRRHRVQPRRRVRRRPSLCVGHRPRHQTARLRPRGRFRADERNAVGDEKGRGVLVDALVDDADLRGLQNERAERADRGAGEEEVAVEVGKDGLLGSAGRGSGALVEVAVEVGAEVAVEVAGIAAWE